jgi:hypothetical protein
MNEVARSPAHRWVALSPVRGVTAVPMVAALQTAIPGRTGSMTVVGAGAEPVSLTTSRWTRTGYGAAGGSARRRWGLPGELAEGRVLPAAELALMLEPTFLGGGAVVDYGLGTRLGLLGGRPLSGRHARGSPKRR